jgi:polysaccharide pyruvyl transferase CsaB
MARMERTHPEGRRLRIGISGSYGGMNLGDEAILGGILSRLRTVAPTELTVFSHDPSDTLARHEVDHAIPVRRLNRREVAREISELDVLVLGGGGILYDGAAEAYLREVFIAHELGVPVVTYAISAGPLTTSAARTAVRDALNASALITVRDRLGYRLLEDVGVTQEIHLTADPAFLLEPDQLSADALTAEGIDLDRKLVAFSVREPGPAAPDMEPERYFALLAQAADFIIERYDTDVVFVPMEKTDVRQSHAVMGSMRNAERAEIVRRRYSPRQVLDLLRHFDFAVGMRLHFLIFAAMQGVPFTALPYASKVAGLLDDLAMESPPLGDTGIGQLIARIDHSWDTRDKLRTSIQEHMPQIRSRAEQTSELLAGWLTGTGRMVNRT